MQLEYELVVPASMLTTLVRAGRILPTLQLLCIIILLTSTHIRTSKSNNKNWEGIMAKTANEKGVTFADDAAGGGSGGVGTRRRRAGTRTAVTSAAAAVPDREDGTQQQPPEKRAKAQTELG